MNNPVTTHLLALKGKTISRMPRCFSSDWPDLKSSAPRAAVPALCAAARKDLGTPKLNRSGVPR